MKKINFIDTKNNAFIVIDKASGLPSAPLSEDDKENALMYAAQDFPQILQVKGKKSIEYGLLHRLDTVTSGLLLVALNQDFYDYMLEEQKNGQFVKYYRAQCLIKKDNWKFLEGMQNPNITINVKEGFSFSISSFFRHYGKNNSESRPVTEDSNPAALKKVGKKEVYSTQIKIISIEGDYCQVECKITKGFKHQVRCHLGWIGLPVVNDKLYNSDFRKECEKDIKKAEEQIRFSASKIEFYYPRGDLNSYDRKDTWT